MPRTLTRVLTSKSARFALASWLVAGCGGPGSSTGPTGPGGGKTDNGAPAACAALIQDMSGRGLDAATIAGRGDPIARAVLTPGTDCPTTLAAIFAKLVRTDAQSCVGTAGMGASLVSERAQLLGAPDRARAVLTRTCGGRQQQELFFSPPAPVGVTGSAPRDVEILAFDPTSGVYNYYAAEGGKWRFFGDSTDLLAGPGSGSFPDQERRCANCHTGGGPIQKELRSPWNNWEGDTSTPGADETIAHLGQGLGVTFDKFNGITMESMVEAGNQAWNNKRLAFLRGRGKLTDLLQPLFCTVEMNLAEAGFSRSQVPLSFLTDQSFGGFASISFSGYASALAAAGQRMVDDGGQPLSKDGMPLVDTFFNFIYPERSFADEDYVQKLVAGGIVDHELVNAVLGVDFTTPVFSDARCGLLTFAPQLDLGPTLTPQTIHDGFVQKLQAAAPAAGTPAAQLLANLTKQGDAPDVRAAAFLAACAQRGMTDAAGLANDVVRVSSLRRNQLRRLAIVEHAELLPADSLSTDPGAPFALDPVTCKVQ